MKYKVFIPTTNDMSSIRYTVSDKPMESKEQEALCHYNKSREHDGLLPVTKLPKGTTFSSIEEIVSFYLNQPTITTDSEPHKIVK